MPTVERYGGRRVVTNALPGVRKTAAETDVSTGATYEEAKARSSQQGLGQFGEQVAGTGLVLYQREVERADNVALMEADRKLGEWENERLYNPEKGALTIKGKAAMPLPEEVGAEFNTLTGELEAGLKTPRQRDAFARVKAQRAVSLDATLRRHVFGEMQTYQKEELQGLIENSQTMAIQNANDPRRVGEELDRMRSAIKASGPQLGLGPEAIKQQLENVTSATHVGVINRLLANEQTAKANAYFQEAKGEISGDALAGVEKALDEGTLRGESQKAADKIIATGDSLTKQREAVRAIEDPKLRDATMERIEHEASIKDREDRERDEATLTKAYTLVDKTHNVNAIDPATWAGMSGGSRSALRSYAEHLAKGIPVETDLGTYYGLMRKAAEDPQGFSTQNLLEQKARLGETEFKQLAELQLSIRKGDAARADKELAGFRTKSDIIENSVVAYGLDPRAKPDTPAGRAIATLQRMVDLRVDAVQSGGKKATNVEIQQIVDDVLSAQAPGRKGSWLGLVTSDPFFDENPKRVVDMTIGDVPAGERSHIEAALRRAGKPISDAMILNAFQEMQLRRGVK